MNSIVERLRKPGSSWNIGERYEAAAEIERLEARLAEYKAALTRIAEWNYQGGKGFATENEPHAARIAQDALRPADSAPAAEIGWVIEGAWSPTSAPDYWVGSSAWSPNPDKALRFARCWDAEQAADLMCAGHSVRVCCHEWVGNAPDSADVEYAVTDRNGDPCYPADSAPAVDERHPMDPARWVDWDSAAGRSFRPCPLCGRTDPHSHTAGPWGMS